MPTDRTKGRAKQSPSPGATPAEAPRVELRIVPGGSPAEVAARSGRIRNARARAAAGWYDRPEVREQVLEAVLEELSRR
jgi:hypothetical protein